MQSVVEAAWIAAGPGVLGVVGTVTVAVAGYHNTRRVTDQTVQAATQDSIRTLDAARADRLWEQQAAAYAAFITHARSYRNGLRTLEKESEFFIGDLGALAAAADNAASLVFIILTSEATYNACRAVVQAINRTQDLLQSAGTQLSRNQRSKLNNDMADILRVFQVAARDELGIRGVERTVILSRHKIQSQASTSE